MLSHIDETVSICSADVSCETFCKAGIVRAISLHYGCKYPEACKVHDMYVTHEEFGERFSELVNESFGVILEAKTKGEKVVVQCRSGMHRSVALVVAYVMKQYGLTYKEAFWRVCEKHPIAENAYIVAEDFGSCKLDDRYSLEGN